MKYFIAKIGWPVLFAMFGYLSVLLLLCLQTVLPVFFGVLLIFLTEIAFLIAFLLSIRYVYLSKKKKVKLEKSMKLFQQGIWGFLLFVPWVIIILVFWIVMK